MAKKGEVIQYNTEADVETKYVYTVLLRDILELESELVSFHVPVKITQGRKVVTKEADVVIKNKSCSSCEIKALLKIQSIYFRK